MPVPQLVPLPEDARHAPGMPGEVPPTGAQRLSTIVNKAREGLSTPKCLCRLVLGKNSLARSFPLQSSS